MRRSAGTSFYDEVGGHETMARIVDRFYEGVADDPELRPMYPEEDLSGARHRLTMFFDQYWGGPKDYSEQRGHPRLGMRHAPFKVTPSARDRWLAHMHDAIHEAGMTPEHTAAFLEYVVRAAHFLTNSVDEGQPEQAQEIAIEGLHGPGGASR